MHPSMLFHGSDCSYIWSPKLCWWNNVQWHRTSQDFLGRWEDVHICITAHHPDSRAQIFPSNLHCLFGLYKENSERHVEIIKCNHTRKTLKKALQIQTSNSVSIKIYEFLFPEMWSHVVGYTGINILKNIAAPMLTAHIGGSRFSMWFPVAQWFSGTYPWYRMRPACIPILLWVFQIFCSFCTVVV